MAIAATGDLPIDLDEVPLAEVERPGSAAAAADRPPALTTSRACGVRNGRIWTALILIRIQPETTQISGTVRVLPEVLHRSA